MSRRNREQISEIMRRVKSRDTTPEIAFRKALWARGVRYRLHDTRLPGRPDIVVPKAKLAIFIDGDFWHGNQWRTRGHPSLEAQFVASPAAEYWVGKINRNMLRDRRNTALILADDWRVLRFWETDVAANLESCIETTMRAIEGQTNYVSASRVPQQTAADFFPGIGLARAALESAGWTVTFAVGADAAERGVYGRNFPNTENIFHRGNLETLSADTVPPVCLACAGIADEDVPLQRESQALRDFARLLAEMASRRPPMLLIELSSMWTRARGSEEFAQRLRGLNELGYALDAFVLDICDFTAFRRPRLYVVAQTEDEPYPFIYQTQAAYESKVRPQSLAGFISRRRDIRWAIKTMPAPPPSAFNVASAIDESDLWRADQGDPLARRLSDGHASAARRVTGADDYCYGLAVEQGGGRPVEVWFDGENRCIGLSRRSARPTLLKWGRGDFFTRAPTTRELARLFGVPDSFSMDLPPEQAFQFLRRGAGAPVIKWIAEQYLNPAINALIHGKPLAAVKSP